MTRIGEMNHAQRGNIISLRRLAEKYLFFSLISIGTVYYGLYKVLPSVARHYSSQQYHSERDYLHIINTKGCRIPNINPFDPSIIEFYEKLQDPLPDCYEDPFIYVAKNNNSLSLNLKKINATFGSNVSVQCYYRSIVRNPTNQNSDSPDYSIGFDERRPLQFEKEIHEEYFQVQCFGSNQILFEDFVALVQIKPEVEKRCNEASQKHLSKEGALNVILVGIDSISKLNYLRHLTKTQDYLLRHLRAFDFQGYVKVGDNTFPNMVAMLSGYYVNDFGGDEYFKSHYTDIIPLIWSDFAKIGYRTFYIENAPNMHTFDYAKVGFNNQPTDYYFRHYALTVEKSPWRNKNGYYCFGPHAESRYYYNHTLNFIRTMHRRPYFVLNYLARATHDYLNQAGYLDEPTRDFFHELKKAKILNSTAVIFFSDHGIRFGDIRKTYIGKIEERMPFMFQLYPKWFLTKHPEFERSLTINQGRLTTPFDVHRTLRHILELSSKDSYNKTPSGIYGQSLFTEIPSTRTCADAGISSHWCTCYNRLKMPNSSEAAQKVAKTMVDAINMWTNSSQINGECFVLDLEEIIDVYVSVPQMLLPPLDNTDNATSVTTKEPTKSEVLIEHMAVLDYLATIRTVPGDAVFEGTVRLSGGVLNVVGDISRINMYKDQSWCMTSSRLKKYCYCKKPAPNSSSWKILDTIRGSKFDSERLNILQ